ncbi:hypothetical protein MRB53_018856 [Persea americana]|uniref:Uncharacterized protein n=1 Tax=Persea americana TaxID=3435 RepID=A0ACC2M8Q0_PERAE|nr:hypothetical protein MRB53_018856 [Persea americana]|eukprot:TRINITY_DN7838_c0_g2_i1.p1 TRINITY_DN7838_c0_g2~~TRINITY_DN7838_c0_g2_i1.p1  ORF type:complete len:332 (+),score=39.44 TRINITY_DN7838_c0_g2_i1:61-1056(+)
MATLVAGSYEKFIWGFQLKNQTLKTLFSFPSHLAPIKSVAVSGPVAVSGASDDAVKIYDLSSCSEVGSLTDHNGAVTSLSFFNPSPSLSFPRNLFSASDDGTVCIYDADPFVHLKTITAHRRGGISDLAVHPSGKLALTVGRDACLAMLNLVRGRRSFCCRLDQEASIVSFDRQGVRFFMSSEVKMSVHESEDARLVCEFENPKRVLCLAPGENGLLFAGGEDHNVTAWDTVAGKVAYRIEDAHLARVKGLVALGSRSNGNSAELPYLLASASSDGVIRVWDVRMVGKEKPSPLAEVNTKSRLTCLAGSSKSSRKPLVGNSISSREQDIDS